MGCVASKEQSSDAALSQARLTDRYISQALAQSQKHKKQSKILLLGTGESGKSTVLKQLRILHRNGFSQAEKQHYSQIIWLDTVHCMAKLVVEARRKRIGLACDGANLELRKARDVLLQYQKQLLDDPDYQKVGSEYLEKYLASLEYVREQKSTGEVEEFDYENTEFDENTIATDSTSPVLEGHISGFISKTTVASTISRLEAAQAIGKLWSLDPGIKQIYARRNEFQMESNADYFFEDVGRVSEDGYLASNNDILKARIKTTGITETSFRIQGQDFKILDAGGQRSERRKWLRSFEDVTAILFVLAVSEYDQVLYEDSKVNRMQEAMVLFKALVNSKWFHDTPFILFLNKTDTFSQKIQSSSIRSHLPDYTGREGNYQDGMEYIENTFRSFNKTKKPIYMHRTCATDTDSMKFVLAAVTDLFIRDNLRATGMM